MTWSAAEITALATKAARGAGAPPAQAARFGKAAALHLMLGRDPGLLEAALEALPQGPVLIYPLAVDQGLSEISAGAPAVLRGLRRDALLVSYIDALPFVAWLEIADTGALHLWVDLHRPKLRPTPQRITRCDRLIAQMTELAERTFVPESDTSRRAGAGSGLSDND